MPFHHPLKRWLFEHGETTKAFADRIGCTQSMISFWVNRQSYPTMERMVAIAKATDGGVMPNDFMPVGWNTQPIEFKKKTE